jgi:hypothetical protein
VTLLRRCVTLLGGWEHELSRYKTPSQECNSVFGDVWAAGSTNSAVTALRPTPRQPPGAGPPTPARSASRRIARADRATPPPAPALGWGCRAIAAVLALENLPHFSAASTFLQSTSTSACHSQGMGRTSALGSPGAVPRRSDRAEGTEGAFGIGHGVEQCGPTAGGQFGDVDEGAERQGQGSRSRRQRRGPCGRGRGRRG